MNEKSNKKIILNESRWFEHFTLGTEPEKARGKNEYRCDFLNSD